MPVSIRSAPATDRAGVIAGRMGNPSISVVFVVVMFNEPLGIGVAVTKEVLDEETGILVLLAGVPAALLVIAPCDVLTSLSLTEDDGLGKPKADDAPPVVCGVI